jgi:predicted nucleic acid-binding protein
MSRAVLADTGPLYAAVDPDDAHHRRAQRELKRLDREGWGVVVAYPTLLETYTLVLYRLGKRAASDWLADILNGVTLMNPDPEDYRDGIHKVARLEDQPITLFDATLAAMSVRLELEVWTYDHDFDVIRAAVWR